jgi:hypothetical protein
MIKISFDGTNYGVDESKELRKELIKLRDEMLKNAQFKETVVLSHAIAWMACVIEDMELEDWSK